MCIFRSVCWLYKNKHNFLKGNPLRKIAYRKKWNRPEGYNTSIQLYNPITKSKQPFIIKNPDFNTWYMCGPTVYDSAHIGHACCYVRFDIIRRILLNYFNVNVVVVMGITDIDDKIITRANELNRDYKSITTFYENEFFEDMNKLNVLPPTVSARVTDHIPNIISFIQKIIDEGYGYTMPDGSVHFNTSKYTAYGKLCKPPVSEGANFALWKGAKPGEPSWNAPWGKGRPGWHIECSTIASFYLGSNIDIHSGGIDLQFPHHENEEAQSCTYHSTNQWVNYWLHSGHLNLQNDEKMSKSLKNTISVNDFLQSNTAEEFRIFCLLSPYRNRVEFSSATLNNAKSISKKIVSFISDCEAYTTGLLKGDVDEPALLQAVAATKTMIMEDFCDDFDTARAMNSLIRLIATVNKMIHSDQNEHRSRSPGSVAAASAFVRQTLERLGVQFSRKGVCSKQNSDDLTLNKIMDRVADFRNTVRLTALQKDDQPVDSVKKELLQACDTLRDELKSTGIIVKDYGKQSSWSVSTEKCI